MSHQLIFSCIASLFLFANLPAEATQQQGPECAEQPKTVPAHQKLAEYAFDTDFKEYVKTTVACDSEAMTAWFTSLNTRELLHFRTLYGKLKPLNNISREHQILLNNCLYECYNSFSLHNSAFSKELLDMMDVMGHDTSCQFLLDLCGMFSINELEHNWYPVIIDLFKVLPACERNLTSLTALASILHVERDDRDRLYHFRPEGSNQRLILLQTALTKGEVLDMDAVRSLMKVRPSNWQYIRERTPELAIVTIISVLTTATLCLNCF